MADIFLDIFLPLEPGVKRELCKSVTDLYTSVKRDLLGVVPCVYLRRLSLLSNETYVRDLHECQKRHMRCLFTSLSFKKRTHTHTHTHTYTYTHTLTHSLTRSLTHSLSLTHTHVHFVHLQPLDRQRRLGGSLESSSRISQRLLQFFGH
jgi:hypothetical protein